MKLTANAYFKLYTRPWGAINKYRIFIIKFNTKGFIMSLLLLPASISLLLKLFILWTVIKGGRVSILFLSLIAIFALHNAVEIFALSYMLFYQGSHIEQILRPFYIITVFAIMYITLHALTISETIKKTMTVSLVVIASALSSLILLSDFIIAGHYSIGYSISAVKGSYDWLFAAAAIIGVSISVGVLVYGYRNAATQIKSTRCLYSLYALIPIFLVAFITVTCKLLNIPLNATAIMPIATTVFLFIVIKTESKHKLSEIKRLLPMSLERKTADNFLNMLDEYVQNSNKEDVYKNLQSSIEREIICYSLEKSNNNITHTANMMGLKNRSTLYSMLNRHGIDLQKLKAQN